ncbi:TPA: hypothetical protein ACI8FI_001246 [Streptococcus pyogenes]
MMIGLFLLLWAGVGFIQNKDFFSSCPKEVFDVIEPKEKRFRGQSLVGWILAIIAILFMGSSIIVGAVDGVQNNFTYIQFFIRFLMILLLLKAFDIVFFDWVLLCNRGFSFFEKYYPEVANVLTPKLFGYNKRDHIIQIIGIVVGSILLSYICKLF